MNQNRASKESLSEIAGALAELSKALHELADKLEQEVKENGDTV